MQEVSLFSLERHEGPYEKWPLRTRLLVNGEPSRTRLPGYTLLRQFATDYGFLLVTDYDCPFEETTNFILLDSESMGITSYRQFFVPYSSFSLDTFEWIDRESAQVTFYKDDRWLLTLRPGGIPFISPRLRFQRVRSSEAADA